MTISLITRLSGAMLVLGALNSQLNAQTTVEDVSAQDSGISKTVLVALGPDERIWSTGDPQSNRRIVEVGTGMNYWDGETWTPSDPTFDVTDDAFIADRVQFSVRLSANLNKIGAVTVVTPDGLTLHSTPVGIGLYDPVSGKSAIIAAATNTFGVLVGDSRVVYENAFAGICADVVYTIDRSSFSQDVVITGRLDPADWGFPPTARIQTYTEFYNPPKPDRVLRPIYIEQDQGVRNRKVSPDFVDELLGFGEFVLGTGRAATLANMTSDRDGNGIGAIVAKQFTTTAGRTFLIESVEYKSIQGDLESLPECSIETASIRKTGKDGYAAIPPRPPAVPTKRAVDRPAKRMAQAAVGKRAGLVIDYVANIGGTISSAKIFAGDTTYFLTNAVTCNGSVTIEGGAVFKYPTNANTYLKVTSTLTCKTASFRPAIFTAADDNTAGDTLSTNIWSGYTGTINTNGYANPAIWITSAQTLSNVRVRYAQEAIRMEGGSYSTINHAQLINCIRGIVLNSNGSGSGTATINNSLMANVQKPLSINNLSATANFYHATVDTGSTLVTSSVASATANFYNSVSANVTTLKSGTVTVGGNHDGFYISPLFGTSQYSSGSYPFQAVGAGNYYLIPGSPFRDVGITNGISSSVLKELRKRTTFPPLVLTNTLTVATTLSPQAQRDTDTLDLGFHYEAVDWAVNTLTVTNTALTLTNGVALATFGTNGIWLQDGSQLFSEGTPLAHNHLTRYYNVQEQGTNWGGGTVSSNQTVNPYNSGVSLPIAQFRFTDFDGTAGGGYHLYTSPTNSTFSSLLLQDCSMNSARVNLDGPTNASLSFTNNLFERVAVYCQDAPQINFYNNLVRYSTNFFTTNTGANNWIFKDNAFDNSWITDGGNAVSANYNAYINMATNRFYPTNANDQVLTNFTYATGTLGSYYQSSTNLIDMGSVTNAALRGLYHYTTQTSQVKEANSVLDVGFHYVATDANGNPIDTNGDGIPDYLADRNGNGITDTGELLFGITIDTPANGSIIY